MILVFHGAKKNVGDYLIRERGLALLRHLRPDQELVLQERWKPIDPAQLERADAAVLCGGPGLASNFYPKKFPLTADVASISTPIYPIGVGWSGQPADHPEDFRFDGPSTEALRSIHQKIGWSSVRDDISLGLVERAEVGQVRRSGCTAWYHVPSLGKTPEPPKKIRSVVFTPPADSIGLFRESAQIMRGLAKRYPDAVRSCVFHRGLKPGVGTGRKETVAVNAMAAVARSLGFQIVDAAFDLSKIDFYGDCDLHVGYRVHAHLCFVSQRRASLLLCEDGRGTGQLVTLNDPYVLRAGKPGVVKELFQALATEEADGHPTLHRAVEEIERTWPVMKETIEQLPAR